MYEELTKALRNCSDCYCGDCKYKELMKPGNCVKCMNKLIDDAADAIDELQDTVQAQDKALKWCADQLARRWIPVTERLPEIGERVLCYCRANIYDVLKMRSDGSWVYEISRAYMSSFVTHWMPLPEPPKDDE